MAYGTVKVDNVTFTYNAVDATTTFSGFYASTTNNLTLSGTASAATFTGTTANFTNVNAQNISVTTALSGLAITGGTAGFTTVTGTTVTGTTANFVSGVFTTRVSGTTITGTTASFTSGVFTSLSGTTHTITSGVFASGTAALPSISFVSDPNTGVFSPGADQLAVATNGVERLRLSSTGEFMFKGAGTTPGTDKAVSFNGSAPVNSLVLDSSGRLGIGTSSPGAALDVNGAIRSNDIFTLYKNSSDALYIGAGTIITGGTSTDIAFRSNQNGSVLFSTNGTTERMRIDATGRVGINATNPAFPLQIGETGSPGIAVDSANSAIHGIFGSGGNLLLRAQLAATAGGGQIFLGGSTRGDGDVNAIIFSNANFERARIDPSGRLLVGTSSGTSVGITVGVQYGGINFPGAGGTWANWGGSYGMFPFAGVGLGIATGAAIYFVGGSGGNLASINGTTGVYTALSDAKKKKDFEDSSIGLAEVLQLKPKLYRMLDDADDAPKELGFIAQEVKLLIPQAYVENKITEDDTFIGLQDRPIVAALVKGMQEQQAIITALEARLSVLEGA